MACPGAAMFARAWTDAPSGDQHMTQRSQIIASLDATSPAPAAARTLTGLLALARTVISGRGE